MELPETEKSAPRWHPIIGKDTGLSVVVVIAMIGAAIANVTAMGASSERTRALESRFEATTATLTEIKISLSQLTGSTQREINVLQRENADIRERLAREIGELRVRIAELRGEGPR